MAKKVNHRLSQARAYWRLASKAERSGNYTQGARYRDQGNRFHRMYLREKEALERLKKASS